MSVTYGKLPSPEGSREAVCERLWFEVYSARCGRGVHPLAAEIAADAAVSLFRTRWDRLAAAR